MAPAADALAGLRIGIVGPQAPPAGGMANQTRQLTELLREANAQVRVVATNAAYRPVWVARVPILRAFFRLPAYCLALWRLAGASDVLHLMANSGWSWHLFAAPAIWIAWSRRTPIVVNYRGGEAAGFLARSQRAVRWSMRRSTCLAVPSSFLREIFSGFGMTAEVLPNIVDLRRFSPAAERRDNAGKHLVVTRNLEPIYDVATAIHAFSLIRRAFPAARLTVAGSGLEEASLRRLCTKLGLAQSVCFAGRLDRDQIAELYRDADLTLNPSLADNMPNSVLESLASGVPVVSTNVGGIPHLVEHGVTALLVAPRDASAMAQAACRLLGDTQAWQALSSAGILEVQRYTWQRVAPQLSLIYRKALSRRRSCRPGSADSPLQ